MARDYEGKKGCCTVRVLEGTLHGFNILFLLTGLGSLGVALWTILDKYKYVEILTTVTYPVITYFLLSVGALVVVVSIIGCCAICNRNRLSLVFYIFFLLLIFLVEGMVGSLAFLYGEQVQRELELNLNTTFLTTYKMDAGKTEVIDFLQEEFSCCGAASYEDWQYSAWIQRKLSEGNLLPDSCCKTVTLYCGRRDHPSNINYEGCMDKMAHHMKCHLFILTVVGFGICLLHAIGIILACKLYLKLRYVYLL